MKREETKWRRVWARQWLRRVVAVVLAAAVCYWLEPWVWWYLGGPLSALRGATGMPSGSDAGMLWAFCAALLTACACTLLVFVICGRPWDTLIACGMELVIYRILVLDPFLPLTASTALGYASGTAWVASLVWWWRRWRRGR